VSRESEFEISRHDQREVSIAPGGEQLVHLVSLQPEQPLELLGFQVGGGEAHRVSVDHCID
jgi:hypothetical protein